MEEQWIKIKGFDEYEVSDRFRVRRKKDNWLTYKIINPVVVQSSDNFNTFRYKITLRKDNKSHQVNLIKLVAQAFVPKKGKADYAVIECLTCKGPETFHIDYVRWVDREEATVTSARMHGVNHITGKMLTSDYVGVYAERRPKTDYDRSCNQEGEFTGFYIARARVNGKYKYIGRYTNQEDARDAREKFLNG
jgi:hypothetical protein